MRTAPQKSAGRIGFVTEDKELYPYMTVRDRSYGSRGPSPKWRNDLEQRYLEMFDFPKARRIPELSKGMRSSKLMLLLAICRGAELLILDEPTRWSGPSRDGGCATRIGFHHRLKMGITIFFFASTVRSE